MHMYTNTQHTQIRTYVHTKQQINKTNLRGIARHSNIERIWALQQDVPPDLYLCTEMRQEVNMTKDVCNLDRYRYYTCICIYLSLPYYKKDTYIYPFAIPIACLLG